MFLSSFYHTNTFIDRQLQAPVGSHYVQQVPGYNSVPLRPGEILQEFGVRRRERDQSREYRTELEREPAQRRPNMASRTNFACRFLVMLPELSFMHSFI